LKIPNISNLFGNFSQNNTNPGPQLKYQPLFDSVFLRFSLELFYKRIFRDSLLLNFTGKEHFELGLFGVAKQKEGHYIRSVLDIIVLSAIGSNSRTEYFPVGVNDDLDKPLPKGIKGAFCGFIQSPLPESKRMGITPGFNLDWELGLRPLLQLNVEFLNSMRLLIGANQTPIIKVDPAQLTGNFNIVKEELIESIRVILNSWQSFDNQKAVLIPSGASFEFSTIDFSNFDYIQTLIAQELSKITGFTITYLLGKQPQGLNATGDNDHLQNIKMFKVYGRQYSIPLIQQIVPALDIPLTEKAKLLNIKYYKTIEELAIAFQYLDKLETIDLYLKENNREAYERIQETILGLFE